MLGAAVAMLSVTACKKDYTCSCKSTVWGDSENALGKQKKADAEDACAEFETGFKLLDPDASCSI